MAIFVLVHGTGCGGWYWRRTAALLRSHGHDVYTPTQTGNGERVHLLNREVDLDTHITDIVNCLKYEDLRDVNLVGHSYGGMVVTGAADRERERIRTLTYLDALVPKDNQAVFDLMPPERAEINRTLAKEEGDGWRLPSPPGDFWKLTDPDDIAWFNDSCTDHPLAAFEQRIRLKHADGPVDRRVYIWASGFAPSPFEKFAAEARNDPAWTYREIQSGHMPMISHPAELTALLEEVTD